MGGVFVVKAHTRKKKTVNVSFEHDNHKSIIAFQ
jgi:hypothetical protein